MGSLLCWEMLMRVRAAVLSLLLLVGAALSSDARATYVDFTTETYTCPGCGSPDGAPWAELLVDGVTWTFTVEPVFDATLFYDTGGPDGFGVRYAYERDEIEGSDERLVISFSEAIYIGEVHLTDLFYEHGYRERGWLELNSSGSPEWFIADWSQLPSPASNGELIVSVDEMATSITFGAPGRRLAADQGHEFSVAGIDATRPMPEPTSMVLFTTGGVLVARAVSRKRRLAG
jgi:hypothetical protein